MKIAVYTESALAESRVALTPEACGKLAKAGHAVFIESGAGKQAFFTDAAYAQAGATVFAQQPSEPADVVLTVAPRSAAELASYPKDAAIIGMLEPFNAAAQADVVASGLSAFSLELAPRTTRAQSLDVLSSQANIAGYKAVLLGTQYYGKFMPMLMTAAGTVKAAKVVVLGVGVAGLQAIATAKRLGAVIEASDVRPSVKEQIESLGGKFIDVPYETDEEREAAQGVGGYAKPMPASWLSRQAAEVAKRIAAADIVISTAQIPGRPAPKLISAEMVRSMKPGSVIVDLAARTGESGNCALTRSDEVFVDDSSQVTIVGLTQIARLMPADASTLYSRNLLDFLKLITIEGQLKLDVDDDIVQACWLCANGQSKRSQ